MNENLRSYTDGMETQTVLFFFSLFTHLLRVPTKQFFEWADCSDMGSRPAAMWKRRDRDFVCRHDWYTTTAPASASAIGSYLLILSPTVRWFACDFYGADIP